MRRLAAAALSAAFVLTLLAPAVTWAAVPPPNDMFENAQEITSFPYPSDLTTPITVDLSTASVETGEPTGVTAPGVTPVSYCNPGRTKSVWYRFVAPGTGVVVTRASGYTFTDLRVVSYRSDGAGFAGLTRVGCRFGMGDLSPITSSVKISAGLTYYVQVSDNGSGGGPVDLTFRFYLTPGNDMFADATVVTTLPATHPLELWAATFETGEPTPCALEGVPFSRSVWYRFVAPGDGDVTVTVTGDGWEAAPPTVYLQSGPSLGYLGSPTCGVASATTVSVQAGNAYYVQVSNGPGGWGSATIDFRFGAAVRPANDDFEAATTVPSLPFSDSVDIRRATMQTNFGEPNPCGGSTRTIWYAYTPDRPGYLTVDPTGSSFSDASLTAYFAWGQGFSGLGFAACSSYGGALRVMVDPGSTYYIQASDRFTGGGRLNLSFTFAPPPPPNDDRDYATSVSSLPFSDAVDTTSATAPWPESGSCGASTRTVWYRYTPSSTGAVIVESAGSDFTDGVVNVYTTGPGSNWWVGCGSYGGSFTFGVRAGWTYYIQAADGGSGGGTLRIRLSEAATVPNDAFADARVIDGFPFTDRVDVAIATNEAVEPVAPCGDYAPLRTVWYRLTPPDRGTVSVGISDTIYPMTTLAAYRAQGAGIGELAYLGCADYPGPLTFDAIEGATYYVQVADWLAFGWVRNIDFTFSPTPDTSPPVVSVSGAAPSYAVDARVAIAATAVDDRDGPLTPTCTLVKDGVADPVSTSCAIDADAWSLGLGRFTFTAAAVDAAGNAATATASFDLVATYPSVRSLTLAWTKKASVAKDLVNILDSAYAAEQRGQFTAEANKLKDYRAAVKAQSGKAIDADKADLLITFSLGL